MKIKIEPLNLIPYFFFELPTSARFVGSRQAGFSYTDGRLNAFNSRNCQQVDAEQPLPGQTVRTMQLHIGAELFGNVMVRYSEITSKYHIGA